MTPEERQAKIREIANRLAERLEREWPATDADITDLEDTAERAGREVMREVSEELLREQAEPRPGNQTACPCGARATFRGYHERTVVTAHGRIPMRRAYYYCRTCRQGHCPLDRQWRLGRGHTTPTVQARVAALGAHVPYTQIPTLVRQLGLPLALGVRTLEQLTQQLGAQVGQTPPAGPGPVEPAGPYARPLAVAVDGILVPTRAGYKEVRCGVIYTPNWGAGRRPAATAAQAKEYLGTTGSRDQLVQAACARAVQRRPTPTTPIAALGDGAPWIWEGFARHLPQRVEILDFYHASQHLGVVAAAWHGEGTPAARAWLQEQQESLRTHGPDPLLRTLAAWQPPTPAGVETQRREGNYFRTHRDRMQYPVYLAQGLPIGSGAVEGACKHVVADRCKGTGMRWNLPTLEPVLQLRAALLTHPHLDLRRYATPAALA